ncbi:MAG: methyltransferase domain-containing protein [Gemmatimonadetes bacterium]|nr:methyltransferase domain-containing protein [Gemmatimonadota bacterium]NNM32127.1 methyltransferase domain-containing protein [Gemmatimonadota bacterium]
MPHRLLEGEHMDNPGEWKAHIPENLEELARTNRWFGGTTSVRTPLRPLLPLKGARILDVGTADGATLAALGRWAANRGAEWELHGLDLFPGFLELAGPTPGFTRCVGDAVALPFPDRSFDAAVSLQTLHHFDDHGAVSVLRELTRVSRNLVVVSDLRRSLPTYAAARGLATFFWRNAMTRHDGPRSVRASFTPDELVNLGRRADPDEAWRVRAHGPFRIVLECARGEESL